MHFLDQHLALRDRSLQPRLLRCALLDIERRRQAEARTAEAQSSLQRVIEAAPLAITLYDASSLRVLQVNQVAARSTELPATQLIGRTPDEIYPPAVAERRRWDMAQALAASDVTQRDYRVEANGEVRQWDARYLPLAAAGSPPTMIVYSRLVTASAASAVCMSLRIVAASASGCISSGAQPTISSIGRPTIAAAV